MGTGSRVLKNPDSARFRSGFGKLHVKCYPDDLKSGQAQRYSVQNPLMLLAWASRTPQYVPLSVEISEKLLDCD